MASIHLLHSVPVDNGTYSDGLWSLPLTNLKTRRPTQVARSTNALTTSTKFVVDLGAGASPRPIKILALITTNLTANASVRFRVSDHSDGSSPTLDSLSAAYTTNVVWGSLPWGMFPWDGVATGERPGGAQTVYVHPTSAMGRYVLVDITDTSNPDGFVQIGRFMAGDPFAPKFNMAVGSPHFSFVDESRQDRTLGGALYSYVKPKRRRFSCNFDFLTESEAWGAAYDMQDKLGISGELFMVYDPDDDPTVILRRAIYGTMPQLENIVTANTSTEYPYSWQFVVEELL